MNTTQAVQNEYTQKQGKRRLERGDCKNKSNEDSDNDLPDEFGMSKQNVAVVNSLTLLVFRTVSRRELRQNE